MFFFFCSKTEKQFAQTVTDNAASENKNLVNALAQVLFIDLIMHVLASHLIRPRRILILDFNSAYTQISNAVLHHVCYTSSISIQMQELIWNLKDFLN